jgi:hypothetical protein
MDQGNEKAATTERSDGRPRQQDGKNDLGNIGA